MTIGRTICALLTFFKEAEKPIGKHGSRPWELFSNTATEREGAGGGGTVM
jgi:hypothetical protein